MEKDFNRNKMRHTIEDVRRKSRAGSDDFRRSFKGKPHADEKVFERKADRRYNDDDRENFTEEFHERQVDYQKNVRTKREDR